MQDSEWLFESSECAFFGFTLPRAASVAEQHKPPHVCSQSGLARHATPWLKHELPQPVRSLTLLERVLDSLLVTFAAGALCPSADRADLVLRCAILCAARCAAVVICSELCLAGYT